MSRGLGAVQREVLETARSMRHELRPDLWIGVEDFLFSLDESRARSVSVHRAINGLVDRRLLERAYFRGGSSPGKWTRGESRYQTGEAGSRWRVAIRLPLTKDEKKDLDELFQQYDTTQDKQWISWFEQLVQQQDFICRVAVVPGPFTTLPPTPEYDDLKAAYDHKILRTRPLPPPS